MSKLGHPNYSVSDLGRLKNVKRNAVLKCSVDKCLGYVTSVLVDHEGNKKSEYLHQLVLRAFKGESPTPNMTVDHINKNRTDNQLENVR